MAKDLERWGELGAVALTAMQAHAVLLQAVAKAEAAGLGDRQASQLRILVYDVVWPVACLSVAGIVEVKEHHFTPTFAARCRSLTAFSGLLRTKGWGGAAKHDVIVATNTLAKAHSVLYAALVGQTPAKDTLTDQRGQMQLMLASTGGDA